MKLKGFIKLRRSLLSDPMMMKLIEDEGARGLGTYIIVLLYLAGCDDCEGAFTYTQVKALAAKARRSKAYVRRIIEGYGLFTVNGERFFSEQLRRDMNATRTLSCANHIIHAGKDVDVDKEKEVKKQTGVCLGDTPVAFDKNGIALWNT